MRRRGSPTCWGRLTARLLLFAGIGAATAAHTAQPLTIVTTTTDLASLVEAVGGEAVAVESLAPPLGDPHALEIKPSQIARLKRADLVVKVGLDHEPWLRKLRTDAPVLDASRNIALLQAETPRLRADARPHVHGLGNTHYWLDPENARPVTAAIAQALSKLRPGESAAFTARRQRFLERLDQGLARWREALGPWKGTRVVVVHETWPYFAARFGLEVVGAAEPVPGVPPTPTELARLIERMRATKVRVLIADPHSDGALVRTIATRAGARVASLVPSVGADPAAADYIALFDLNVKRLADALADR